MERDLDFSEQFLVDTCHIFESTLHSAGYLGSSFWIHSYPEIGISYKGLGIPRTISIIFDGFLYVEVKRTNWWRNLRSSKNGFIVEGVGKYFGVVPPSEALSMRDKLVWNHDVLTSHLMPVITGKLWIDELLQSRQTNR